MTNKPTILLALLLAGCASAAAASEPGLFKTGNTTGGDGWKLTWTAVSKPPLSPGQHIGLQTDATHTDVPGRAPVFHRFFSDPASRTYFGYDVLVTGSGKTLPATVTFQPLSLRGDQLPREYGASGFHAAGIPQFPTQAFQTGQTIAIDVLQDPKTGHKVVDYVKVTFEPHGDSLPSATERVAAAPAGSKLIGSLGAPVRIELFSDFQCPGCKAFHDTVLPLILKDYVMTGKAYIVSREFPLAMHPYARDAANLATAAAQVGKYQTVADALFRRQAEWAASGKVWDIVAPLLTPDERKKVQLQAKDPSVLAEVQRDMDEAIAQKINRTPTVVLSRGAKRYPFPGPELDNYQLLKSLIDQLLK